MINFNKLRELLIIVILILFIFMGTITIFIIKPTYSKGTVYYKGSCIRNQNKGERSIIYKCYNPKGCYENLFSFYKNFYQTKEDC